MATDTYTPRAVLTQDNTSGYTPDELAAFNLEAMARVPQLMDSYGMDQDEAEKAFCDEISRR